MRLLYSLVWWLLLPLALLRLWWRGRKEPGYLRHIGERLGFYRAPRPSRPVIWVHAVSVGETRAAEPLIHALLAEYPDHDLLLTHMTATGRETGAALFSAFAPRVTQSFLPYDTGWMMSRFLRHFSPRLCILMETEIWPNLIAACQQRRVPVVLANARLSERSLARASGFAAALMRDAAAGLACAAAQTEADAARLVKYGARRVEVTGSVKFDASVPDGALAQGQWLRERIGARPVLMCASTREGEEALLLDALPALGVADALLLLVPRHPQRFDEVAQMVAQRGLALQRRSQLADAVSLPGNVQVLLGDSMGEMFAYYAACDAAFVGGSLLPLGGQNLIEACAVGKPVLIGPHTFNFDAITEDAIAAGAALRVQDAPQAMQEAHRLLTDPALRANMGRRALDFALRQRGAAERTLALLRPLLTPADSALP